MARVQVFIAHDRSVRVDRGYVRPEDEPQAKAKPNGEQDCCANSLRRAEVRLAVSSATSFSDSGAGPLASSASASVSGQSMGGLALGSLICCMS
jgi:hypothetical protein